MPVWRNVIALLFFLSLHVAGCMNYNSNAEQVVQIQSNMPEEGTAVNVSGYVIESAGGPAVPGSVLTISGQSRAIWTDAAGSFTLSIKEGAYDITAEKEGFAESRWQNLTVDENGADRLWIHQPRVFCSDWKAEAPLIKISGIESGAKLSGTIDISVTVTGSNPVSMIKLNLGNFQQEPLKSVDNSDTLSFSWDTSELPDGLTYIQVTAVDINYNNTRLKVPVILENKAVDESLPGVATIINNYCYTYAACYDHDLRSGQVMYRNALPARAPADTTISSSLSWTAVEGARGYRIYRAQNSLDAPVLIDEVLGNESVRYRDFDPTLASGQTLYYYISAFNNAGEGEKTAVQPLTVLDRFTVRLKSPCDAAAAVSAKKPVFEWEISGPVGDVQKYHLVLMGYNDAKGEFTWETDIENATTASFSEDLLPAEVYHWDIIDAYAGKDYVSDGVYRSMSLPGLIKIDPYSDETAFVTSSENGEFTFTTDVSVNTANSVLSADSRIIARLSSGTDPAAVAADYGLNLVRTFRIGKSSYGVYDGCAGEDGIWLKKNLELDCRTSYAESIPLYHFDAIPDDPDYGTMQYCHIKMNSEKAWDITAGGEDTTMAIIDTGLDGTHPEFLNRTVTGHNFSTKEDVPPGAHFDSYGHGTHVAGIAGATGNNEIGVAGVNWKSRIMPLKVNDEGEEVAEYVIEAIIWAADHNAGVINMSLGSPGYSQALQDAITYACRKGVSVVVSMGNKSSAVLQFPAGGQGVIAVGSTDGRDEVSNFSSWGRYISLSAPGDSIYSTSNKEHGYKSQSGTSMSTPQVAGAVSLLKSLHPGWTIEEIRSQLETTADDVGDNGFDIKTGWGRLNLFRLLSTEKVNNRYAQVRMIVKDSSGNGIDGADVLLLDSTGLTASTVKSDSDGYACFFYIPAGSGYRASARYQKSIGVTDASFDLEAGSGNPDRTIVIGVKR
ncbi:MAG: S8 family serine peptidase [Vulcanimicrobiota bacterium]